MPITALLELTIKPESLADAPAVIIRPFRRPGRSRAVLVSTC